MTIQRSIPVLVFSAISLAAGSLGADGAQEGDRPLASFGWLGDLVGSCWSTNLPDGKTNDTQCYEARLGRFLFGSVKITEVAGTSNDPGEAVTVHRPGFAGESVFAWDAKNQKIVYWFWANDGAFGTGEAFIVGELIHFPHSSKTGGVEVRSTWKRLDTDSYRVAREQMEGGTWTEKWSVVYKRVGH